VKSLALAVDVTDADQKEKGVKSTLDSFKMDSFTLAIWIFYLPSKFLFEFVER